MAENKRHKNLKPWPKGVSGNPAGAPKGKRFKTVIRELMELQADVAAKDGDKKLLQGLQKKLGRVLKNRELIVFKQMLKAITGDTSAFTALADREEGRPVQENENRNVGMNYTEYLDHLDRKKGGGDDGAE